MSTYEDDILRSAIRTPEQDAAALARCTRLLDGDALAKVLAMLDLEVAE